LYGKQISISFITEIELGSLNGSVNRTPEILSELFNEVVIVHSNPSISKQATLFRNRYRIPVADAIVAATAHYLGLPLITANKIFMKIPDLRLVEYRTKTR
jgi:predicted nucleic acid-binding protein